jgi:hypothetical protein
MNIQIVEGRLPNVSPVATPDQIEQVANVVYARLMEAVVWSRAAVKALDEGLHSAGVEDADTMLDTIADAASQLADLIEAQRDIQIEHRRGDR